MEDQLLEARLRAWFESLVTQPVPDSLLSHLDQLTNGRSGDQSSA
jgi:hypothetical protein